MDISRRCVSFSNMMKRHVLEQRAPLPRLLPAPYFSSPARWWRPLLFPSLAAWATILFSFTRFRTIDRIGKYILEASSLVPPKEGFSIFRALPCWVSSFPILFQLRHGLLPHKQPLVIGSWVRIFSPQFPCFFPFTFASSVALTTSGSTPLFSSFFPTQRCKRRMISSLLPFSCPLFLPLGSL